MQPRPLRSSARLSGGGGAGAAGDAAAAGAGPAGADNGAAAAAAERARRRAAAAAREAEVEDSPRVLRDKCRQLAAALRSAKHLVVYTGAGISTAADIPDYRGPRGVWTRLRRGESVGRVQVAGARPTLTHMALAALHARGALRFVVSQNCDGLHARAGLPRRALAELHGNMFAERCAAAACRRRPSAVYLRAFDTTQRTARRAHGTRRLCHACGAPLQDSIVHFGERGAARWPLNWAGALRHAAAADVILCLGSSLKVLRRYPRLWSMARAPQRRPRLFIVNLQWTPKDAAAELKINARCDAVMAAVARLLRLRVPRYSPRRDPLLAHATRLAPPEAHTAAGAPRAAPSPPPAAAALSAPPSPTTSYESLGSPSASDSEEERPLRSVAQQLRLARDHPQLRAFQVSLKSSAVTILLRAHDAPSVPSPPPPPPEPPPVAPRAALSALRAFRMARRANGAALVAHPAPPPPPPAPPPPWLLAVKCEQDEAKPNGLGSLRRLLWPCARRDALPFPRRYKWDLHDLLLQRPHPVDDLKLERDDELKVERGDEIKAERGDELKAERGDELKVERGDELKAEESDDSARAAADEAARRHFERAVQCCRAHLYPGLHTILGAPPPPPAGTPTPPPPAAPPAECAWCWRRLGARRCQWYPAREVGARRVWRRVRGRRYLCTCCPRGGDAPDDPAPGAGTGGGWYGKGCRKGRRR